MKKNLLKCGVKLLAVAMLLVYGGGVFLISCKNASDSGGGGGGGGSGSDSRSLSNTIILDHTNVTIQKGDKLEDVLRREEFLNANGTFKKDPPNPNPNAGANEKFKGILLIKRADGTTKYVPLKSNGTLDENPEVEDGVQVVAVYSDKDIRKIKIEVEPGKIIEVPVSFDIQQSNPTLQEVQDALEKYGIKPNLDPNKPNTPKCPDPSYEYKGVKAGSGPAPITDFSVPLAGTDLTPVFQKELTYTLDKGDGTGANIVTPKPVVTYPVIGVNLKTLLGSVTAPSNPPTSQEFVSWEIILPNGDKKYLQSIELNTPKDELLPDGVTVKPSYKERGARTYKLEKADGTSVQVSFKPIGSTVTLKNIIDEATNKGLLTHPAGYGVPARWTDANGTTINNSDTVSGGENTPVTIKPVYTKSVTYNVDLTGNGPISVPKTVTYPNESIKDLFPETRTTLSVPNAEFVGWKVTKNGTSETLTVAQVNSNTEVFPSTATISPVLKLSYTLTIDGQNHTVKVESNIRTATWTAIKAAAKTQILSPAKERIDSVTWKQNNVTVTANNPYAAGLTFASYETISYSISLGSQTKPASFPDEPTGTKKTLVAIFTKAGVNTDGSETTPPSFKAFSEWKVTQPSGTSVTIGAASLITNTNTFPKGTKIEPTWIDQLVLNLGKVDNIDQRLDFTKLMGFTASNNDVFVANTETTRGQWIAVMGDDRTTNTARWNVIKDKNKQVDANGNYNLNIPMTTVTLYEVIVYCNKLSKLGGREPVYYLIVNGEKEYDPDKWGDKPQMYYGNEGSRGHWNYENHPWGDIARDNTRNGFVLPTESEWKFAAQGGNPAKYPMYSGTSGRTEADLDAVAWTFKNSSGALHEVNTKGGDNPIRDMTGSVWEMIAASETETHGYKFTGGPYDTNNLGDYNLNNNPKGPNGAQTGTEGIGFRVTAHEPRN